EVARTDQRILCGVIVVGRGVLEPEPDLPLIAQWKMTGGGNGRYSRQMRKSIKNLSLRSPSLRRIRVATSVEQSSDHELVAGIKAEWRLQYAHEAADQQTPGHQQYQGSSNFRRGQGILQPLTGPGRANLRLLLQRRPRRNFGHPPRRDHAGENRGYQR